jgi:hypothetical protein
VRSASKSDSTSAAGMSRRSSATACLSCSVTRPCKPRAHAAQRCGRQSEAGEQQMCLCVWSACVRAHRSARQVARVQQYRPQQQRAQRAVVQQRGRARRDVLRLRAAGCGASACVRVANVCRISRPTQHAPRALRRSRRAGCPSPRRCTAPRPRGGPRCARARARAMPPATTPCGCGLCA